MNGMISTTMERKTSIVQASPQRHSTLRHAAQVLSLRNVDAAVVELFNEALARMTMLCYERDELGELCNVDHATGRVLVPSPWGRAGYARWGLRPAEANVYRLIMLTRQRVGVPLYAYDRSRRAWYLNLRDYPDGKVVLAQLNEWQITLPEYRAARAKLLGA